MTDACSSVLVSSLSKKVPLVHALRRAMSKVASSGRIYGADVDETCIGRHFVDGFWKMPRMSDLTVEVVSGYCQANGITCIIPTRDGELLFYARNREYMREQGIHVMVSPESAVELCLDKLYFSEFLTAQGFPAVQTASSLDGLEDSVVFAKYVVKERYGAGSQRIGLGLTKDEAQTHAVLLHEPVFQPYVNGQEMSVDLYVDRRGRAKGAVVRSRDVVVNGESQVTQTVRNPALEQLCSQIAERLGLYGHVIFQVMVDAHGNFHVIECNGRFGGGSSLSLEVGLESFYWFLLEAVDADLDSYPFCRSTQEKRLVRHAQDLILPVESSPKILWRS